MHRFLLETRVFHWLRDSVQDRKAAPRLVHVRHKRLGDDILISGQVSY